MKRQGSSEVGDETAFITLTHKTVGAEAGIQDKVLDAICGHGPPTVGEGYRGVALKAKVRAMGAFPWYRMSWSNPDFGRIIEA